MPIPTLCPGDGLCNSNGVCDGQKCICYDGYFGEECECKVFSKLWNPQIKRILYTFNP